MAWTDAMVEELRKMWKEGLTTGEIGKRLNVSKNSIVGKVHRLGLSGRPSPIKKKEESDSAPAKTEKKETSSKPVAKPAKEPISAPVKADDIKAETIEKPTAKDCNHKKGSNTSLTDLDNHTCRWPLGDPKDENFHFCGKKVRIGQTYCEEHSAVAYVKPGKK